jgi:hypothetical protein
LIRPAQGSAEKRGVSWDVFDLGKIKGYPNVFEWFCHS